MNIKFKQLFIKLSYITLDKLYVIIILKKGIRYGI